MKQTLKLNFLFCTVVIVAESLIFPIGLNEVTDHYPGVLGLFLTVINTVLLFSGFAVLAMSALFITYSVHFRNRRSNSLYSSNTYDKALSRSSQYPFVTILIPMYEEPPDVVEKTIGSAAHQHYPREKYELIVINDSSTPSNVEAIKQITQKHRAKYLHRDNRRGFKAGAINDALRISNGEYLLILDADSTVPPDALMKLVPHFEADNKLGYIQCITETLNWNENLLTRPRGLVARIFWTYVLQVKQELGGFVLFAGHNGMLRKTAVEDVGGFREESLTEDLEMTFDMRLKGWKGRYVDNVVMTETTPETFGALRKQHMRWAYGTTNFLKQNFLKIIFTNKLPLFEKFDLLLGALLFPLQIFVLLSIVMQLFIVTNTIDVYSIFPSIFLGIGIICGLGSNVPIFYTMYLERKDKEILNVLRVLPLVAVLFTSLIFCTAQGSMKALMGEKLEFLRTPKGKERIPLKTIVRHSLAQIIFGGGGILLLLALAPVSGSSPFIITNTLPLFALISFLVVPFFDLATTSHKISVQEITRGIKTK